MHTTDQNTYRFECQGAYHAMSGFLGTVGQYKAGFSWSFQSCRSTVSMSSSLKAQIVFNNALLPASIAGQPQTASKHDCSTTCTTQSTYLKLGFCPSLTSRAESRLSCASLPPRRRFSRIQMKLYTIMSTAATIEVASTMIKPGAYVGASLGLNNIGPTKFPGKTSVT
jgi:hypothetical protein